MLCQLLTLECAAVPATGERDAVIRAWASPGCSSLAGAISGRRDWEGCCTEGGARGGGGAATWSNSLVPDRQRECCSSYSHRGRELLWRMWILYRQVPGCLAGHPHGSHCHEEELWDDKLNFIIRAVVSLSLRKPNSSPFPIARSDCALSPWADLVTADHQGLQHRQPPDNRGPASRSDRMPRKQGSAALWRLLAGCCVFILVELHSRFGRKNIVVRIYNWTPPVC